MWYTIGMATEHEPAGVSFRHVEKVYAAGQPPAVDDFTLDVRPGEFLVLVGPSGCGKSTTLRMVAGLELPTGGTVSIGGRDVTYLPPKDRDIAMVFQNYALYPHMTVRANMGFALRLRHVPKDEIARRVAAAARWGLSPTWTACRRRFRADSASAWRSVARSCASRRSSSSTNPFPTSTRRCASRCAPRSCVSTNASARR